MDYYKAVIGRAPSFFARGYTQARVLFQDACRSAGADMAEYKHPLLGLNGEALAVEVARLGPADAAKLLIVISGTHGVEGFTGSGCQVAWLKLHDAADLPADTAVLLIHMLNPWGCSWQRRQNESNVDLNRNFRSFNGSASDNPLYEAVHPIVMNPTSVVRAAADPALTDFRRQKGDQALAVALFSGQSLHNDGVGFCGDRASWSNETLQQILKEHGGRSERVALLDVHTGLGPYGYGTLVCAEAPGSAMLERTRAYFGPGVVSVAEASSIPYELRGNLLSWAATCIAAEVTSVGLEFGTFELAKLLELQVDDCRLRRYPERWGGLDNAIRGDLVRFFYPATTDWLQSVMLRTLQVIHQSIDGLQSSIDTGSQVSRI